MKDTVELKRDCEAIAIPSGLRQTLPQGTSVRIVQARGGSYTVSTKITAMYRIDGKDADALGFETTGTADQSNARAPWIVSTIGERLSRLACESPSRFGSACSLSVPENG